MKHVYIFFLFIVMVASLKAQYSLPIYEPFAINLGSLSGQDAWTGTAGVGLGAQVVDSNLTYNGLPSINSYAVRVGNQPSGSIQQLLFTPQSTKTYASYLIRLSEMPPTLTSGTYYVTIGNGQTPGGTMYAIPNSDGSTFELGFTAAAGVPATGNRTNQKFALGQTIMVVMAYTPGASGAGSVSAWINPSAADLSVGATEPTPNFSGITGGTLANAGNVFIRSGSNTRSMIFDELRIGNDWGQVTTNTIVLPVRLKDFALSRVKNVSSLTWSSIQETNFSEYVVLFSNDGTTFNTVGNIAAKGDNSEYTFNYPHTSSGYFKLKMVDKDCQFTYSNVLYAASVQQVSIQLYPNPVLDRLYITGMPLGKNNVEVFNIGGVRIKSKLTEANSLSMPLSDLPKGMYFITICNNGNRIYSSSITK